MRHRTLVAVLIALSAGTANAVPLGTGTLTIDVQGPPSDNQICSRTDGFANQTRDIFGVDVNLSTDLGTLVCTSSTVGGVPQGAHCQASPNPSVWAMDLTAAVLCLNPPGCNAFSFVTSSIFNVSGTLPASIGADVSYTADGEISLPGSLPASDIPGCPIVGSVFRFTGTMGFNAFQTQATATGSNQTVTFPETTFFNPLTMQEVPVDVGITFSQVTGSGTTTVTASSNAAAVIPSNFATSVNGFTAAFLEISTTATVVPPITVCTSYDDIDDDGFVDGTSPLLPEGALSFMHAEGDPATFVDRTSSRDAVNNAICAQVDSLSPFAVVVRTNATCAAENDPCDDGDACTVGDTCNGSLACVGGAVDCDDDNVCTADVCVSPLGCTHPPASALSCNTTNDKALLLLRDDVQDTKDQLLFKWLKGTSPLPEFGDPTAASDYTVCAFDANKVLASARVVANPICGAQPCWKFFGPMASPKGVLFSDPQRAHEGIRLIKGKADAAGKALVLFKAQGAGLPPIDLAGIVYPVTVQVRTSDAACWEQQFTSGDQKKNTGTLFKAVHLGP